MWGNLVEYYDNLGENTRISLVHTTVHKSKHQKGRSTRNTDSYVSIVVMLKLRGVLRKTITGTYAHGCR